MRRFHIPIVIGCVLSFTLASLIFFFRSPYANDLANPAWGTVITFLLLLTIGVTFGLGLLLFYLKRLLGSIGNERLTTRESLRQAFWVGLGVMTIGLLKTTQTLNVVTLILTGVTLIILENTFKH